MPREPYAPQCRASGPQKGLRQVLATASFPCVDLSLAGQRKGLNGSQSGLVFDFLRILDEMGSRAPRTLMIENVPGFLTANGGRDWRVVLSGLHRLGYATNHICVNASAFVAQSRARVISERRVKAGIRQTLWVQARRLEQLAKDRLEAFKIGK